MTLGGSAIGAFERIKCDEEKAPDSRTIDPIA
jgi:hypothetical protein